MRLFFFITLLFFNMVHAQSLKVTYLQTYNYDFADTYKVELYIDGATNKSVAVKYFENTYEDIAKNSSSTVTATLDRKVKHDYLLMDLKNKKVEMYYDLLRNFYEITDVFPDMKWTLLNETKKIESVEVKKAITTYRGKNWEVWYASSIPYSFGPWKLNGLPGLILEATDDTKNNYFTLQKIEYNVKCNNCEILRKQIDATVSVKDYYLLVDDKINFPLKDLPRNVIRSGKPRNILDLETEFEFPVKFSWEK